MKLTPLFLSSLIASTGIHIALLVPSYSTDILLSGSKESIMSVKLEETKHSIVNPPKDKNPQKNTTKTIQTPVSVSKNNPVKNSARPVTTSAISTPSKTESKKSQLQQKEHQAESRARVISVIYKELKQHFIYPKLAVRRNWQGKVLLSLQVTASGHIKKIQLEKGSGYQILDQAAIKTLSKIENLPYTSTWLDADIELMLPIIYKLTES